MSHLTVYSPDHLISYTNARPGETKIGQTMLTLGEVDDWEVALGESSAKYVLVGIPEDIGVRANNGRPGAAVQWSAFLKAFCNMQDNLYLDGSEILILGHVELTDLMDKSKLLSTTADELRQLTAEVDERVHPIIRGIAAADKTPIVIGGGHNNSYNCLRGVSEAVGVPLNCLNVDAHTDLRPPEGRHSGNGFTYALQEGFLEKYYVYGLQESYTPHNIYEFVLANYSQIGFTRFEAILKNDPYFQEALEEACEFLEGAPTGLEIDLDVIAQMPTSAVSPDGFLLREVRQLIRKTAEKIDFQYLHICEGVPGTEASESERLVGRSIAFLVSDFIKIYQE